MAENVGSSSNQAQNASNERGAFSFLENRPFGQDHDESAIMKSQASSLRKNSPDSLMGT
jgi:hypothetical protein